MKTKAIIVDDEKMARMLLKGMVGEFLPNIEVVGECSDLPSAVKAIVKMQPDLVFLDIEMPGHSGLELLDFFDESSVNFKIIFITAYNQYAIQAFKLSAIDYLLKPIDPKELIQAYDLFLKNQSAKQDIQALKSNFAGELSEQKIAIHSIGCIKYITISDIIYLSADGSYTNLFLKDGQKITASKGLKYFEDILMYHNEFMRCQKSHIINLSQVTEFKKADGGSVVLNHKYDVSVSADKFQELNKRLQVFVKNN
jgi:two-component system, LytTR family, response regulator